MGNPDPSTSLSPAWIEKFVWRHCVCFGRLASLMAVLAVASLLMGLLWLSFAYDKVFSIFATTDIVVLDVSKGSALQWPLGGARKNCDEAKPEKLPRGSMLEISAPARVVVRLERPTAKGDPELFVFQFEPVKPTGSGALSPIALLDSPAGPARPMEASVVCLDAQAVRAGLNLPVRGNLEIGADVSAARTQILREGEAILLEAPTNLFARLVKTLHATYQFEGDRSALRLGDKVLLRSAGDCEATQKNCTEAHGFLRLSWPKLDEPPIMQARIVTTSDELGIVRPSQQITRLRSSLVRRVANDPWVAGLLSLGLFFGAFASLLLELLHLSPAPSPSLEAKRDTSASPDSNPEPHVPAAKVEPETETP